MNRAIRLSRDCASACAILAAASVAHAQRYDITYLEFPEAYISVEIADINNHGDIVGTVYDTDGDVTPTVWRNGGFTELPYLRWENYALVGQGGWAFAWGINNLGQVVGQSRGRMEGQKAVLWPVGGGVVDLLNRDSIAIAINDAGVIVGKFSVGSLNDNAFRWESGNWDSLYPPMRTARSINNLGQIVGYDGSDAYLWNNGEFTTLPSLGGANWCRDINDVGQIVGSSGTQGYPVAWYEGLLRELPHFGIGAWAQSINGLGDATGKCFLAPGVTRACIWHNKLLMNLNDLTLEPLQGDWAVEGNAQVNDSGQIASAAVSLSMRRAVPVRLEPVDIGLTLWGIDPSRPGRRNTIEIHHVSPNGRVILLWGTTRGEPQPFQQCSGAMIDLADPHLAAFGVADSNGVARITLNVPANVEGNYIFQAVDHTTCEVSPPAWALFKMVN